MKKILLLILLMQTNAVYLLCFAQGVLSPNNRGMERVMRIEQSWDWGTYGHGSFDDAVRAFNAEKDVATYLVGASTFRVFTRFKKNSEKLANKMVPCKEPVIPLFIFLF